MPQSSESRYVPALGFHWLTPAYDVVIRLTTREKMFKAALIDQAKIAPGQGVLDLACGTGTLAILAKKSCPLANVTAIDGFKNTQDNVGGKLIELFQNAGFSDVSEERTFSTLFGTMSLYRAVKAANRIAGGLHPTTAMPLKFNADSRPVSRG